MSFFHSNFYDEGRKLWMLLRKTLETRFPNLSSNEIYYAAW